MLKTQEVPFEWNTFFIAVMLIISARCSDSSIIKVNDGKVAHLKFSYPCDSTKVTLRFGHRRPFYRSSNPEAISLPRNHVFENNNDTVNDNCSLHLTINPVSRDDAGTYILTAYKNGQLLPEYPRIGLRVDYPPGKASCGTSNEYADEWVALQCTAPAGNLEGQIVCYQNGMRLPELTKPEETDGTLRQTILARLVDPVNCCSSSLKQTPSRCECKDCGWNPIGKSALTNITDPCPASLHKPHFTSPQTPNEEWMYSVNSSLQKTISKDTPAPQMEHPINLHVNVLEVINCTCTFACTCMVFTILMVLCICNIRQTKQLSKLETRKCRCELSEGHMHHHKV